MRKSRFTEAQIVRTLKEVESGRQVKDVRRLKELQEENARLKRMYTDLALENTALKDVITKKL